MPHWMGSAFAARGGGGWWTLRPPALVFGHVVWLPYDKIFKAYIWKALGLWNWEAETVCGLERGACTLRRIDCRLFVHPQVMLLSGS